MNVFEDLIVELKQENLLERTVIDDRLDAEDLRHLEDTAVPNTPAEPLFERFAASEPAIVEPLDEIVEFDGYDTHLEETVTPEPVAPAPQIHRNPRNGQEFYRKRAMSEVSNLQMVEHVLSGVEREYMKLMPRAFDDFEAKKALNTFLQVTENENSNEHKEAEFKLMTETEAWCTALATRDKDIAVASLRQFCEGSRPPLSSQALVALGRFYRNLPYSAAVRSKFDFVITRLFSRPIENEMRVGLFTRDETLAHIQTLYRDWSSIALYGADGDDSNLSLSALSFEDLAIEAENSGTFDQLIGTDFFSRVRTFKDSIGELFYAPSVLAAAIDANVRIGNAYVRLIERERRKLNAETIELKYGTLHDDNIADGIGRTLELVDLLKTPLDVREDEPTRAEPEVEETHAEVLEAMPVKAEKLSGRQLPAFVNRVLENAFSINRWLLAVCGVLIAASVGIYVYANYVASETVKESEVRELVIDDPVIREFVTTGRVTDETFYGLLLPTWNSLSHERKEEIVTHIYLQGKEKGYKKVNLIGPDGRAEAFVSATRIEVKAK